MYTYIIHIVAYGYIIYIYMYTYIIHIVAYGYIIYIYMYTYIIHIVASGYCKCAVFSVFCALIDIIIRYITLL